MLCAALSLSQPFSFGEGRNSTVDDFVAPPVCKCVHVITGTWCVQSCKFCSMPLYNSVMIFLFFFVGKMCLEKTVVIKLQKWLYWLNLLLWECKTLSFCFMQYWQLKRWAVEAASRPEPPGSIPKELSKADKPLSLQPTSLIQHSDLSGAGLIFQLSLGEGGSS